MEALHLVTVFSGVALGGVGACLILTNPGQSDYESYATEALTTYLKQEVCVQASGNFGGFLSSYCKTFVDTGRPHIQKVIANKTIRQNYVLFSIYETELFLPSPVPNYQFETIGAFQQFYTYQADQF
ncbi:DUF4359 domain-containing protein [Crocosphaera sp. XPORK-15E]|uniref:DUF4359 domain-containing protein n=1 Tax=Crocosphaera sp. XPORK-15E TaxID=3110247 RepID=UPI002B21D01D|nr:DUF4359 domain-containing protein [Crocosphaera sp. XPORK-15E]MEA5534767.1 DUF4359 domain-containing protein [Crocosphaera sp. XPORK-15E]